jgi:hypothetical protein
MGTLVPWMDIHHARTGANQREIIAKLDAHHERMMARVNTQPEKMGDLSKNDGGHGFGCKSRRNIKSEPEQQAVPNKEAAV